MFDPARRYAVLGLPRSGTTAITRIIALASDGHKGKGEFFGDTQIASGDTPLSHIQKNLPHQHDGTNIAHKFLMNQIKPQHQEITQWLLDQDYDLVYTTRDPVNILKSNRVAAHTSIWENFGNINSSIFQNLDMSFPIIEELYEVIDQYRALWKSWKMVPEDRRFALSGSPAGIEFICRLLNVNLPTTPMNPMYPPWDGQDDPGFWDQMYAGLPDDVHEIPERMRQEPCLFKKFLGTY